MFLFFVHLFFLLIPKDLATNGVGSFASRRILDDDLTTNNNEENTRSTSTKQRFNISSNTRPLIANYDPSQSPLFSLNARVNSILFSNQ